MDERVTYADRLEDGNLPWCGLYHICPSNIAWLDFYSGPRHLVPRRWLQDTDTTLQHFDEVPAKYIRSDGMFWTKFRSATLCGLPMIELPELWVIHIASWRVEACLECWAKRW